jgi:hypothetical protein
VNDDLCKQLLSTAERTAAHLSAALLADGSFREHMDLASYYKAASIFLASGRTHLAHRLLDFVVSRFMLESGDFHTPGVGKTSDALLAGYPGYPNGWIAMAAQRLGRFDISYRAWRHLRRFHHPMLGGSCLEKPYHAGERDQVEMLMTAHLGLAALYFGEVSMAESAGGALLRFVARQPAPDELMLLRMDQGGELIADFTQEQAFVHKVLARGQGQGWFFVGYPIAFLGLLYRATGRAEALDGARAYLEFALRCPGLPDEHFAHKVAWGASIVGEITREPRYLALCEAIARQLIANQAEDGLWLPDQAPQVRYDQSAEVALWLLEIARVFR